MKIGRERQPHHPERQAGGHRDPRSRGGTQPGLRDLDGEYAGRSGVNDLTGGGCPLSFLWFR